jgi:ubiquinone/menaquinone biosynthesis C-methylase UbiE
MRIGDRLFAAIYDRMLADTEDAGLRERRRLLLQSARGRVLEIGAGTGLNLPHYGDAVTELVLTEPSPSMARRLRERVGDRSAPVVEAPAEALPFDDGSFDTVVCTLVLCTVPEPERAVAEIGRVLKPGGRVLFIEHVRSEDPKVARWQDRLRRPWGVIGNGCQCNRDTLATLTAGGLTVEQVEHGRMPKAPPIVRPTVDGTAVRRPS